MVTSLQSKWQFALFAALLYLSAPLFNAAYDMIEDQRGTYPPSVGSIGIDIHFFTIALVILSPVYAAAVWLATRCYQGGLSLLAFGTRGPFRSGLWSLLLGGLVLADLYDAVGKASRILLLEVVYDLAWVYLLLCLRSSLTESRKRQTEQLPQ